MLSTTAVDLIRLGLVFLLVLANAFFVAAELSLVSVRRTRIAELAARGDVSARAVQKVLENPDRVIAATQLGITIASLALGWLGEPALAHLISPLVEMFPSSLQPEVSHSISAGIAFLIITTMHVVAGELAPKSIALQDPERTSLAVAVPTLWTERLFKPAIWVLNGLGNGLLRLIGIKPASGHELVHSVEELKMLVSESAKEGVVEAEEREMLHAVFDFGDLVVRQVMIPRTEIVAVEVDTPIPEVVNTATQSNFTKFPVYEQSLDQIVGIIHVKDLLNAVNAPNKEGFTVRTMMREPLFVPETISVRSLLRHFRDNRRHIAIVMDEYSGTAGLVTLEDLLEEIVGEVSDPFNVESPSIQVQNDGTVVIDGLTLIEEVDEELGLKLHDPDYDTIAGYFLGRVGHIPRLGETFEGDGVRIRVEEMDGLRISKLSLTRLDPPPAPEPGKVGKNRESKST